MAKLDTDWLDRLSALTVVVQRLTFGLAVLLLFGIIVTVHNTLKLVGESERDFIEICRLIGRALLLSDVLCCTVVGCTGLGAQLLRLGLSPYFFFCFANPCKTSYTSPRHPWRSMAFLRTFR